MYHIPVLTKEVMEVLDPKSGENFIDGTVGEAGHALLILEKTGPDGRVLGIDQDQGQIENSKQATKEFKQRVVFENNSYANIKAIASRHDFKPVNGILLDLGYSSWQLAQSMKGFSFQKDEKLDMRYSLQNTLTAKKIVNDYPEDSVRKILEEYGEEKFAKKIAKEIVNQRSVKEIESTFQLRDIIQKAVPKKAQHGNIHPSTRTFQALRIAVNDELGSLAAFLPDALSVLPKNGRLAVISFHSLEDRIVKKFFKEKEQSGLVKILTKKPIVALSQELLANPRSRSAKLRAIIKL